MILAHHLLLDYALICTHFGRFWHEFDYGVVYNSFERVIYGIVVFIVISPVR